MVVYPCSYAWFMTNLTKKERAKRKDPLAREVALTLGRNLRTQREKQNLTQERLGYMIDSSHPRISDFERGLVDARLSDIIKLARALNVDPGQLIDWEMFKLEDYPEQPPDGHARL